MPSLDDLRDNLQKKHGLNDLKKKLQKGEDTTKKTTPPSVPKGKANKIEVTCNSIEEGIEKGSNLLGVSRINLDYDIIQRGSKGFMGVGKKPFILMVYIEGTIDTSITDEFEQEDNFPELEFEEVKVDGEAKVLIKKSGIFLVVTKPKKGGTAVTLNDVKTELARKSVHQADMEQIKKIVSKAKGKEEKIGKWVPNPQYDSRAILEISDDEMKAVVNVTAPILSGRQLDPEEIVSLLENNGVKYGIKHDKIKSIIEKEIYNVPVVVAEGEPAETGNDAFISYHFKTKHDEVEFREEEDGSIDFKKTDLIQNVVPGQILATKTPATEGKPGRTVTNMLISAANGKNIELRAGKNANISPDGLEISAAVPGQAILLGDKVEVEEILEIKGDVDYNSGNVTFLGTVLVTGNVQDDFSIKAAGDIIIKGDVGKAVIEAEGDITISKGILGKEKGLIKSGGSVYAKFIENANISASIDVVAKEGIIHSKVDAGGRVICNGKRASIVGGRIRAGQEINSKILGSQAYTETICEAGVDPKVKERLEELEKEHIENEATLNKLIVNVNTLLSQKEAQGGKLPNEKETMLQRMVNAKEEFTTRTNEIQDEIEELRNYLTTLENCGKVSAKVGIFPGVEIIIKNANFKVKQDFKFSTFVYEAGYIKPKKYEPVEGMEDDSRSYRR